MQKRFILSIGNKRCSHIYYFSANLNLVILIGIHMIVKYFLMQIFPMGSILPCRFGELTNRKLLGLCELCFIYFYTNKRNKVVHVFFFLLTVF